MSLEIQPHHWSQDGESGTNYWVYKDGQLVIKEDGIKAVFDTLEEAEEFKRTQDG